ncbi:hypothetical protein [Pedobacter caeni]|uniref:Uncharacterized protein n=1 Tax=Pedobacter caeni TaxID=288992 RepID=A0A1M5E9V3_9SPHI|nr:hypothetical protein [Pedobacter caeni]SHF75872.1 hypothetical protein SAMN04488522_103560 [Pedobacter caeni]
MKNINYILLISLIMVASCTPKTENNPAQTPEALQDDYSSLKRSKGDLVDELYQELLKRDSVLKTLAENLNGFRSDSLEAIKPFYNYLDKSENYYAAVNRRAKGIKDSLLMKSMQSLIASHQKAYKSRTAELNSLLDTITHHNAQLNDNHDALKIAKTLPMIEKYQKENQPNKNELKKLIGQQEKMLKQMKDLLAKP